MKRNMQKKWFVVTSVSLATVGISLGYAVGRARAAGIPASQPMTYAGTLSDASGAPLTGTKKIQLVLWDQATGGSSQCSVTPTDVVLAAGGSFQLPLPDPCTAAVHAKTDLWVELVVDNALLPRTKLGAVPFAVEADHATNASSVPWGGVTGVPISIQANNGAIAIGGSDRTLSAGNANGNLHIDSDSTKSDGHIYLDYYSGKGTYFGNGAGTAVVGSMDTAGNFTANGTISAGLTVYNVSGSALAAPCAVAGGSVIDCTCPTGMFAVSGGGDAGGGTGKFMRESRAISTSTWRVTCVSGTSDALCATYNLVCSRVAP